MPKKTFEQIVESGNDYIVKVKRNQKMLLQEAERIRSSGKSLDSVAIAEKNRGRKENRKTKTYKVNDFIKKNWPSAKTIVFVMRKRRVKGRTTITNSYYISSLSAKAKEFAKGIRHHWGIENRLHYVKDVTLKEDESKIKNGNAPGILSLIRNLVINIARINNENRIKKFMRLCAGNVSLIISFLE